jgi:hypothetical protein
MLLSQLRGRVERHHTSFEVEKDGPLVPGFVVDGSYNNLLFSMHTKQTKFVPSILAHLFKCFLIALQMQLHLLELCS